MEGVAVFKRRRASVHFLYGEKCHGQSPSKIRRPPGFERPSQVGAEGGVCEADLGFCAFFLHLFLKQQTYRCGVGDDGEGSEREGEPEVSVLDTCKRRWETI